MSKKNNKYVKAGLGLALGLVLLTVAVFANYENAGGYGVCKDALKKIAYCENFTAEHHLKLIVDDKTTEETSGKMMLNVGGNPSSYNETLNITRSGRQHLDITVLQDDIRIHRYNLYDGDTDELGGFINNNYGRDYTLIGEITNGDGDTADKLLGFVETLADTMVGDLKNSIVMTGDEDGTKTFDIILSREQMPSYVTSGVAFFTSLLRRDASPTPDGTFDPDDPASIFIGSGEPYIKQVCGKMSINDDGLPTLISFDIQLVGFDEHGNEHSLDISYNISLSDFGTTEIEKVPDEVLDTLEDYRDPSLHSAASIEVELSENSSAAM